MSRTTRGFSVVVSLVPLVLASALSGVLAGCKDSPKESQTGSSSASSNASGSASGVASTPADAGSPEAPKSPYTQDQIRKIVNPGNLPPYQGPTGSVEGTIVVKGAEPPAVTADFSRCPDAAGTYGVRFRMGPPHSELGGHALADAVVAVTGYEGFVPAKSDHVTLNFEGCAYDRRTVLMTYGQRIEVFNHAKKQLITPDIDGLPVVALRIAAPNSIAPVNLYPPNPGRFHLIDRGVLKYVDNDVFVLFHPLHAATDLKGSYRIDGIPVGKATVNVAHPSFAGDAAKAVEITANVVTRVDLVLTYGESADAGAKDTKDAGKPRPVDLH
jgi:hypothetical protein